VVAQLSFKQLPVSTVCLAHAREAGIDDYSGLAKL
jgi:hypothetical protein